MAWFNKNTEAPKPKTEPRTPTRENPYGDLETLLFADDDLMTRAEKIVWLLGYRGITEHMSVPIFRVLQDYERLDAEAKTLAASGEAK